MKNANNIITVTNAAIGGGNWSISYQTGPDIDGCILSVFRIHDDMKTKCDWAINGVLNFKIQYGNGNGKKFKNSKEASQWAFEHGFLKEYFKKSIVSVRKWNKTKKRMPKTIHKSVKRG